MVGTADGSFEALVALLATGKPFTPHRVKPLIAVPTTAGTGSEVTALGDDLGPRRRQEVFAAPAGDLGRGGAGRSRADALAARRAPRLPRASMLFRTRSNRSGMSTPIRSRTPTPWRRRAPVLATLPALIDDLGNIELRRRMSLAALHGRTRLLQHQDRARALDFLRHDDAPRLAARHRLLVHLAAGAGPRASAPTPDAMPCWHAYSTARWPRLRPGCRVSRSAWASARASKAMACPRPKPPRMIEAALDGVRGRNFIGVADAPSPRPSWSTPHHERPGHPPRIDAHRRRSGRTATGSSRSAIRTPSSGRRHRAQGHASTT